MKIVCASSVLLGREAFSTLGDVTIAPERGITAEVVQEADALITRSKVLVDAELLEHSRVSFVGTATAGTDHMDLGYLDGRQIRWCAAPGCNANSVAEYVASALLALAYRFDIRLGTRTLVVVGAGHVGRRVAEIGRALGLNVLLNDPPLAAATGDPVYRPLEEILPQADIVTLHVPLTDNGPCPTRGLAGAKFFSQVKPGCIFVNTSRGEVVDESVLADAYDHGVVMHGILDVWSNEPSISPELVHRMDVATPHIAGYSYEGKLNGTALVYREACRFFEMPEKWLAHSGEQGIELSANARERTDEEVLWELVRHVYNVETDDFALRVAMRGAPASRGANFERLRAQYPVRREFPNYSVHLTNASARLAIKAAALGFRVQGR